MIPAAERVPRTAAERRREEVERMDSLPGSSNDVSMNLDRITLFFAARHLVRVP
jgi:hypothetical protein